MSGMQDFSRWWDRAACQSVDPELFFPVSDLGPASLQVARAKAVCARCGVRQQCLDYALATRQVHGIWGGTSEDERRGLRAGLLPTDLARASQCSAGYDHQKHRPSAVRGLRRA